MELAKEQIYIAFEQAEKETTNLYRKNRVILADTNIISDVFMYKQPYAKEALLKCEMFYVTINT